MSMKTLAPALAVVLALLAAGFFFLLPPRSGPGEAPTPLRTPPALVRIAGGDVTVGADTDEIRASIHSTGFAALASETPQHSVVLEDFALMPTEVTNEQFLAFVEATGAKPPLSWAEDAVATAEAEHLKAADETKAWARDEGLTIPKTRPFDAAQWWASHWQTSKSSFPEDKALLPVVSVDFEDAKAYAHWAGLWLMSEEEFQAAGRGAGAAKYPWGDDMDSEERANTSESKLDAPMPVASLPGGAAWIHAKGNLPAPLVDTDSTPATGIFDLAGNVWEWTRSPFVGHPGFKPLEV